MNLNPALLQILACPNCRAGLVVDDVAEELVCSSCRYAYPVRDDIPVLLIDEARKPGGPSSDAGSAANAEAGDH
jgi:uncharacterized protein YbaR (Trm112 family)